MGNSLRKFSCIFTFMAVTLIVSLFAGHCAAESVTGQAAIIGNNLAKARLMARYDAMRTYAEKEVGIYIDSATEVALGMVVTDKISVEAQGYVKVKRVIKEWQSDGIFFITLDLEANAVPIQTAVEEVRDQLRMLPDISTRKGVQVAVSSSNKNSENLQRLNHYAQIKVQSAMEDTGFNVVVNDEVRIYMANHPDMSDYVAGAEVRRIARNNRGAEDAILRGTLQTVNVRSEGGRFVATVNASFELVGLTDNRVNSFSEYFTAVGDSSLEAENKANNLAVKEATEMLGKKALELINESEFKHGIQTTLIFMGITNRNLAEDKILDGLEAADCQVINSSFTSNGDYKVFVKSMAYPSLHELRRAVLKNIVGLTTADNRDDELGAQKIYFTF